MVRESRTRRDRSSGSTGAKLVLTWAAAREAMTWTPVSTPPFMTVASGNPCRRIQSAAVRSAADEGPKELIPSPFGSVARARLSRA